MKAPATLDKFYRVFPTERAALLGASAAYALARGLSLCTL